MSVVVYIKLLVQPYVIKLLFAMQEESMKKKCIGLKDATACFKRLNK